MRDLRPAGVRSIVRSFVDVFPHVRAFVVAFSIVMLGRLEPFSAPDFGEIERRLT